MCLLSLLRQILPASVTSSKHQSSSPHNKVGRKTNKLMEEAYKSHKEQAGRGKQLMKDLSKDEGKNVRVICLDLQQTLPVPRIATNVAYYKSKLWLYKLCIHDLKVNKSKFSVWDEVTGGRGPSEIASCIEKWIEEESEKGDFGKLIVFTDNCSGQNKNVIVILNYLNELHRA